MTRVRKSSGCGPVQDFQRDGGRGHVDGEYVDLKGAEVGMQQWLLDVTAPGLEHLQVDIGAGGIAERQQDKVIATVFDTTSPVWRRQPVLPRLRAALYVVEVDGFEPERKNVHDWVSER